MNGNLLSVLTLLSALELVVLLIALAFALRRIQTSLDGINVTASKIMWGVRAIDQETTPLRAGLPRLRATLVGIVGGAGLIAERLAAADQHLGEAANVLGGPRVAGSQEGRQG